jgi:pimeloyl-ACP methyl ester carboxylesterase
MATYALIHGAGSDSWYWHRVAPLLGERGHDVVLVDLPCDDDSAGLSEYRDTVVDAIGDRTGLVLVAQSLAGFTAPLVCERVQVDLLVLLNAMVPSPGEPAGAWWENTGQPQAMLEEAKRQGRPAERPEDLMNDPDYLFLHDLPPDVLAESIHHARNQSGTPFAKPWPLETWPDVPTRFLLSRQDRLFPADFLRRVARERLGIEPDEIDGGHLVALSRPKEVAERLERYRAELG